VSLLLLNILVYLKPSNLIVRIGLGGRNLPHSSEAMHTCSGVWNVVFAIGASNDRSRRGIQRARDKPPF
jgi:hypothetical protein